MQILNFTPRPYQESILKTAKEKNTLVVLPTGMGKTAISLLLSIDRLNKYPDSKIIICSPTKPLSAQHLKTFKEYSDVKEIALLTGATSPNKRQEIFNNSKIITATPQTIQSDLENNRISLENVSLLTIDEAHRSRQKFANTVITKIYKEQSKFPRILALTASPGGTRAKIKELCDNLFIEAVEIRTNDDEDIKPHIQKKDVEWIKIDLPEELKSIRDIINREYKLKVQELKKYNISVPSGRMSKKLLLFLQNRFRKEAERKNPSAYYAVSLIAQILKIDFLIELIETQTTSAAMDYFEKLKIEETKAAKAITSNVHIISAVKKLENLENPKIKKLKEIVEEELKKDNSKIIVFANYRNTIDKIINNLKDVAKPVKLIGQKEGLTQKEQIRIIKDFEEGKYNILCTSQIGEEGLDIAGSTMAIFYDAVASEIRSIQRRGRVARLIPGKIINLIAKGTRDEAFMWTSHKKEKTMQNILGNMQKKLI